MLDSVLSFREFDSFIGQYVFCQVEFQPHFVMKSRNTFCLLLHKLLL